MAIEQSTLPTDLKQCSTCREPKPLGDFYIDKRRNQLHSRCKKCDYETSKPTTKAYQQRKAAQRTPLVMLGRYRQMPMPSLEQQKQIWTTIDVRGADECWPWTGDIYENGGYGKFSIDGIKWRVHRMIWMLTFGKDPGELLIRHKVCENPICCNFNHLAIGTEKENAEDAIRHGRIKTGKESFPSQHPELYPHGDDHWTRRNPEKVPRGPRIGDYPRGDKHHSHSRPETVARGTATGHAKLDEPDIIEIRAMWHDQHVEQQEIALRFGVSRATICNIVNRKVWKHVP